MANAKIGELMNAIRGNDEDYQLTVTDIDGNAIDLTDGILFFTVKKIKTDSDEDALIKKDIDSFDDPTTGIQTLSLTSTDTDLKAGNYWYDVQFKDAEGRITSSFAGKFVVYQDVTTRTIIDNEFS